MNKRFTVIVPAIQVVIAMTAFVSDRFVYNENAHLLYVLPAKDIVMKLNFPLVVVWAPLLLGADWLSRYLFPLSGILLAVVMILSGLIFASSIAAFWYFVVREIGARRHGRSIVTCSSHPKQLLMTGVWCVVGLSSLLYAYVDGRAHWYVRGRQGEEVVGAILLVMWGAGFIGISIHDLLRSFDNGKTLTIPPRQEEQ